MYSTVCNIAALVVQNATCYILAVFIDKKKKS